MNSVSTGTPDVGVLASQTLHRAAKAGVGLVLTCIKTHPLLH